MSSSIKVQYLHKNKDNQKELRQKQLYVLTEKKANNKYNSFQVDKINPFENSNIVKSPIYSNIDGQNHYLDSNRVNCSNLKNVSRASQIFRVLEEVKIKLKYSQQLNKQYKQQNQKLIKQKTKINLNYINFINQELNNQSKTFSQLQNIKQRHLEQLRQLKQTQKAYKEQITSQQRQIQKLRQQNIKNSQRIKNYEENIYKKSFQLEQLQTKINLLKKENSRYISQIQTYKRQNCQYFNQIQQLKGQKSSILQQNSIIRQNLETIEKNNAELMDIKKQMSNQIHLLLSIDKHKQTQIENHKNIIDTLSQQLKIVKQINNELQAKHDCLKLQYQHLQHNYSIKDAYFKDQLTKRSILQKENQSLILKQLASLKQQLNLMKDRQKHLIEQQKNNRQKYLLNIEKRNNQIQQLITQNQKLYKQTNQLKLKSLNQNTVYQRY